MIAPSRIRPIVPLKERLVPSFLKKPPRPDRKYMTLIAGVLCPDGIVLAADSEVTYGDTLKVQAGKLFCSDGKPYDLLIGGSGHGDYIDQFRGDFMRAVGELANPSIDSVRGVLKSELRSMYEDTIFSMYSTNDPDRPRIQLIVGFIAPNKERCIWKTQELAVSEVQDFAFIGSGWTVAHHIAKKLLSDGQPVAIVHHMAYQILLEAQVHSPGVGGDIEVWSYKTGLIESTPFFASGAEEGSHRKGYLWNLEGLLTSAIRDALSGNAERLSPKKLLISQKLDEILNRAKEPFPSQDRTHRNIFPGHQDLHPFRDAPDFYR
ncbi:MAG: hypothetical protein ABI565_06150 [Vicinamibacteria bacterium]